jgi:uncharacterized protein
LKYLVLLAVVVGVLWWLRQRATASPPASARDATSPQDMVPCAHCGVHLPHSDTVAGRLGAYCSAQHRQQHEG